MRFVILGNVGSGKSTLARALALRGALPLLEVDELTAAASRDPEARPRSDPVAVRAQIESFCRAPGGWVVAGTAGHLIQAVLAWQPELVFLNPGPDACLRNCRERSLHRREPADLLAWQMQQVADYYRRDGDERSLRTHRAIYDNYLGPKRELAHPVRPRIADEIWAVPAVTRE